MMGLEELRQRNDDASDKYWRGVVDTLLDALECSGAIKHAPACERICEALPNGEGHRYFDPPRSDVRCTCGADHLNGRVQAIRRARDSEKKARTVHTVGADEHVRHAPTVHPASFGSPRCNYEIPRPDAARVVYVYVRDDLEQRAHESWQRAGKGLTLEKSVFDWAVELARSESAVMREIAFQLCERDASHFDMIANSETEEMRTRRNARRAAEALYAAAKAIRDFRESRAPAPEKKP